MHCENWKQVIFILFSQYTNAVVVYRKPKCVNLSEKNSVSSGAKCDERSNVTQLPFSSPCNNAAACLNVTSLKKKGSSSQPIHFPRENETTLIVTIFDRSGFYGKNAAVHILLLHLLHRWTEGLLKPPSSTIHGADIDGDYSRIEFGGSATLAK